MLHLKKKFGQHFLHDENVCKKIVQCLFPITNKQLVEIGPGGGALTKYLLEIENMEYIAMEIDVEKVNYLIKQFPKAANVVQHIDFLKSTKPFEGSFNIIGNFPYNISSQILFKVLQWKEDVDVVVGMFQKEVAQRVASLHGSKTYGILSVLIQAFFEVSYQFDVHENCFTPPPKVKSGVIKLINLNNPHQIVNYAKFHTLVKLAFGHRRKTLRNSLKGFVPEVLLPREVFNLRPEQLSVKDFVDLHFMVEYEGK